MATGTATSIAGPTRVGSNATAITGHARKPARNPALSTSNPLWIVITTPAPEVLKELGISSRPVAVVTAEVVAGSVEAAAVDLAAAAVAAVFAADGANEERTPPLFQRGSFAVA